MNSTVDGNVSVDTSDVNAGCLDLPCTLFCDQNDQPKELEIDLTNASSDVIDKSLTRCGEFLQGRRVTIRAPVGADINAKIEFVSNVGTNDRGALVARCHLGGASISSRQRSEACAGTWLFQLSNVKLTTGDHRTDFPAPPGVPKHLTSWKFDKISFRAENREWELKDKMFGEWRNRRPRDIHDPIVTASLTTRTQPDDTSESICVVADSIAILLTLAFARSVRCIKVQQLSSEGEVQQVSWPNPMVYPFNISGFAPVDNWERNVLKDFLERAYPVVAANREWWHRTLDMYMQVHANPYIEIKTMILNILADRIAAKLSVDDSGQEIDATLGSKLDSSEFNRTLHDLFAGLSHRWSQDRTDGLIATVKAWNARPSFPEKIRRACKNVGLKPPTSKFFAVRHPLLHAGELSPDGMTPDEYWVELECVVLLLILRMLEYDGLTYCARFGRNPIKLKDYLEADSLNSDKL